MRRPFRAKNDRGRLLPRVAPWAYITCSFGAKNTGKNLRPKTLVRDFVNMCTCLRLTTVRAELVEACVLFFDTLRTNGVYFLTKSCTSITRVRDKQLL